MKHTMHNDDVIDLYILRENPGHFPAKITIGYVETPEDLTVEDAITCLREAKAYIDPESYTEPFQLVKSWPCKRSWEEAVHDLLRSLGYTPFEYNLVNDLGAMETMVAKLDAFFSVMPRPSGRVRAV
jgi:hypothetical protein